MNDVTQLLNEINDGDSAASHRLLPLIYNELRRLAAYRLNYETPGQTIQPTVLVHEAYLRLVDVPDPQEWDGRGHFYAAAGEAMRRILVENARRKKTLKRGGEFQRVDVIDFYVESRDQTDMLALDEILVQFEQEWPEKAEVVKLRYFVSAHQHHS